MREQLRIKILYAIDKNDNKYSQTFLSTPLDMCKIYEGMRSTLFSKLVMENFESSLSMKVTCPYTKNTTAKLTNCSITDKFLPPMAVEKRVKLEVESLGIVKGRSGFVNLYSFELFIRYKK